MTEHTSRGTSDGFEAWFSALDADSPTVRLDGVEITGVRLRVTDLTISASRRLAGSVTGSVTVPFAALERLAAPHTFSRVDDHTLHVTNIEVLGKYTDADARVHVAGHDLVFSPSQVNVSGVSWLDRAIGRVAGELHEVRRTVPGLPKTITLTRARVTEQGLALELEGHEVRFG